MNMKRFLLALLVLLLLTSGSSRALAPLVPVKTARLILPRNGGLIVVLVDHLPGYGNFVEERAEEVAVALRHFSAKTSWGYVDSEPIKNVASAKAVVYLGLNGNSQLSPAALARLRRAHHLIVSGYHLQSIRKAGIAFKHIEGDKDVDVPPNTTVSFKGQTFPVALHDFLAFRVKRPAIVISSYNTSLPGRTEVPYIVQDGQALFVNGVISFDSDDVTRRGAMLAFCDVMTRFIGARPLPTHHLAMLRLEDVSTITPAWRMERYVHYLASVHVPYGIGVIPELRVQGKVIGPLRDNRELLNTLRWAQGHGATIILHGLHHCCSSEDGEGYEFWDHEHNTPVPNDSAEWMHSQVAEGIADLKALGLRPQMWETPHYAASPTDYEVVSQFFGAAWEVPRSIGWSPWVLKRDQYGVMLLPEDLGYVSLDGTKTVADQLARAKELLVCQSCIAAGFLHPSVILVKDLREYVRGLQGLGYEFVDPAQAIRKYGTHKTRGEG
jgi:Uncharacterized protein conserved in bacteria (DUF2334)